MEKKPKQGIIVIRKVIRTSLSITAAGRSGRCGDAGMVRAAHSKLETYCAVYFA